MNTIDIDTKNPPVICPDGDGKAEVPLSFEADNVNGQSPSARPLWYTGKQINEVCFARMFLDSHPMKCVGGQLYGMGGLVNEAALRKELYAAISPYVNTGVAKFIGSLLEAIRIAAYADELPAQPDRIHLANGTWFIDGTFTSKMEICLNRLPVAYNPDAPKPALWLSFLRDLLYEEDIPTLQEYMGYCLIPTSKAQKMLMLIGNGGEGKSRVGRVLRSLLGDNMNTCSIQRLACNRFARADQEGMLVMLDDDMRMDALPDTNILKSIVTMEDKMDMERKGRQSVQGCLYLRIIGFGNGSLSALYDRSDGFYRRQLVLQVKDKPPDRVDDTDLGDKLRGEAEGILLWCLEGLCRLVANGYHFTVSDRSRRNMDEMRKADNNIIDFLESTGYIRFEKNTYGTTRALYKTYLRWCDDNAEKPLVEKTFGCYLHQNERRLNISYDKNLDIGSGKRARGFRGIHTLLNVDGGYRSYDRSAYQ